MSEETKTPADGAAKPVETHEVLRSGGWPTYLYTDPRYAFGERFNGHRTDPNGARIHSDEDLATAVDAGHLIDLAAPPQDPGGASIPVMITHQMETDLLAAGFSQEQINGMTPQEAHELLTHKQ